jgi:hypothetical protein
MTECSICLENMDENKKHITLLCNHKFHFDCLINVKNNKCPLCRKQIIEKPLCEGHNLNCGFYAPLYNKKGKCRICNHYSYNILFKTNFT